MKLCTAIFMAVFCLLLVSPVEAQRSLTFGAPVVETFDSLGTGNTDVFDNVTIQGFYSQRTSGEADPNVFTGTADPGNTAGLYNFGSTGASDRAAGSLAGVATGVTYLGLRYANTTSLPIASITVTYTGEHWRDGNGSESLSFSYQTSGFQITSLTAGTWTSVAALNFTQPTNPGGNGALDGNAAANRTTFTVSIPVNIPVGGEVMLRWADAANGGQSSGLGIDDVSVSVLTVTAGEISLAGRVTTAKGSGIRGAFVTVQGGDLAAPKTVTTTATGEFTLDGLTAGQTYFVSVDAKRYTFADPVKSLDVTDDSEMVIFQALR